jgi:hypothetical protein
MRYFCTYFDSNFLYQGLALYESLCQHAGDFSLWVLCFDDKAHRLLKSLDLPNIKLISLADFEAAYPELVAVKGERAFFEYYWTTTPLLPLFILDAHPDVDRIAYLDADLFFYGDIQSIYAEWGNGSIFIIPHRFEPTYAKEGDEKNGVYNVGLVGFRRDTSGIACLKRWKEQCLEWCFLRYDKPGFLGDQKYLDDWPESFTGVVVSQNHGVGAGGWNLLNYQLTNRNGKVFLDKTPLIMLHLNFVELLNQRVFTATPRWYLRFVYRPYSRALRNAIDAVKSVDPKFTPRYHSIPAWLWLARLLRGGLVFIR